MIQPRSALTPRRGRASLRAPPRMRFLAMTQRIRGGAPRTPLCPGVEWWARCGRLHGARTPACRQILPRRGVKFCATGPDFEGVKRTRRRSSHCPIRRTGGTGGQDPDTPQQSQPKPPPASEKRGWRVGNEGVGSNSSITPDETNPPRRRRHHAAFVGADDDGGEKFASFTTRSRNRFTSDLSNDLSADSIRIARTFSGSMAARYGRFVRSASNTSATWTI